MQGFNQPVKGNPEPFSTPEFRALARQDPPGYEPCEGTLGNPVSHLHSTSASRPEYRHGQFARLSRRPAAGRQPRANWHNAPELKAPTALPEYLLSRRSFVQSGQKGQFQHFVMPIMPVPGYDSMSHSLCAPGQTLVDLQCPLRASPIDPVLLKGRWTGSC